MKAGIHPKYNKITITCNCGNVLETCSTLDEDTNIEVCSECHPFFTGKQKLLDARGQVEKFNKRFGKSMMTENL